MKNKDYVWKTKIGPDQRELALKDMETSHLLNTVMFLTKRQKEYDDTFKAALDSGLEIPELVVNGDPCPVWIERMTKELARRRSKEVEKAKRVLELNKLL